VLIQGVWVFENYGSKKDRLFEKDWVIIANYYLREYFMCGAATATPTTSKTISSELIGRMSNRYHHHGAEFPRHMLGQGLTRRRKVLAIEQ
jgi:hypothetical protein